MLRRIAYYLAAAALLLGIASGAIAGDRAVLSVNKSVATSGHKSVGEITLTMHGGSAPLGPGDEGPEESITF